MHCWSCVADLSTKGALWAKLQPTHLRSGIAFLSAAAVVQEGVQQAHRWSCMAFPCGGAFVRESVRPAHRRSCVASLSAAATFGVNFNQPIAGVVWPASLQQLSFGTCVQPANRWCCTASLPPCSNYPSGTCSNSPSTGSSGRPPYRSYIDRSLCLQQAHHLGCVAGLAAAPVVRGKIRPANRWGCVAAFSSKCGPSAADVVGLEEHQSSLKCFAPFVELPTRSSFSLPHAWSRSEFGVWCV